MNTLSDVPPVVLIALGFMVVLQLCLQVTALVQLVRTPGERVRLGGRKWLWALIILGGEILGAVVWFFVGREPVAATQSPSVDAIGDAGRALDVLYGREEDATRD